MLAFIVKGLVSVLLAYLALILAIIAWCFGDILSFICCVIVVLFAGLFVYEFKKELYRVWRNPWL